MQKIGFCDRYGLTQAVLNGTKTMTRRLEKGLENLEEGNFCYSKHKNGILLYGEKGSVIETIKTRYKLGEVVAVAQSYKDVINTGYDLIEKRNLRKKIENELGIITLEYAKGWSNKMFVRPDLMPHQIQITDINIEQLQDITDEDCLKEGVIQQAHPFVKEAKDVYVCPNLEGYYTHPRGCFATLINRPGVGRKGLWESNPCVVVYQFKLVK